MTRSALPSRLALQEAEDHYARTGAELEGYLSEKSGFLPREPPELALPDSHKAWDEVAAELPTLWRDLGVRAAIHDLPELRGSEDALPARYVRRASTILALLCHSYVYSEREPYGEMPPVIGQAWDDVGRRLGKPEPFLTYEDLILSNWHKPDPAAPMIQEHIEFLVPAVQIQTERHFYLTQLESHIRASPVVGAVVRAQEAIVRGDDDATADELLLMIEVVRGLMDEVLLKLDPNPYSPTHVDPVLFGGIVADLAVPIDKRIPGASGTAAPLLHVFDSFLGRKVYDSEIGVDAIRLRKWGPRALGRFVEGISAGPGAREIMANGSSGLRGLAQTLTDMYSGPRGWLEAHRLKVYGFIEMSFKAGRPVTIGGFAGTFYERPWRTVHRELEQSRAERDIGGPVQSSKGVITARAPVADSSRVQRIVLDVRGEGLVYRSGDRCEVLPSNSADQVQRTLRALKAVGSEPVALTAAWRLALMRRSAGDARKELPLEEFLRYARVRPLPRWVAKALVRASGSEALHEIVEERREDEYELWEALELIAADGFDAAGLVTADGPDQRSLAEIVSPEVGRVYSIASAGSEDAPAQEIELLVQEIEYDVDHQPEPGRRRGTASAYLCDGAEIGEAVPLNIFRPQRFAEPRDAGQPMVVFAEGIGITPIRGMLSTRAAAAAPGPVWVSFDAPTDDEASLGAELRELAAGDWLALDGGVAEVAASEEKRRTIKALLEPDGDGAPGAQVYVSGGSSYVQSVADLLRQIGGPELVRRLTGEGRLSFCVMPTHVPWRGPGVLGDATYDSSDLVLHNNAERGWWLSIDGNVYDMTEFRHLHPGGRYIVDASAGMDASAEYATVLHYRDPEINAMLEMYKIGAIRRVRFPGDVNGPIHTLFRAWIRCLFLVVEMQNAFENDLVYLIAQTTGVETADTVTPLKLMIFSKTHDRFIELYYRGLSDAPLRDLWRLTAAQFDPGADSEWMDRELTRVSDDDPLELERVRGGLRDLWQQARGGRSDEAFWARADAGVAQIVACDRSFFVGMRTAIRAGVQLFEQHQGDISDYGDAVLDALRAAPEVVVAYRRDLAELAKPRKA